MAAEYNGPRGPENNGAGPSYWNQPGTGPLGNGASGWGNGNVAVRNGHSTGGLRPVDNEPPGLASLDDLMNAARQELDQLNREIEEIRLLIRSTNTE